MNTLDKASDWVLKNIWTLAVVYFSLVVCVLVFIDAPVKVLDERVAVVEKANCEGLPVEDPLPGAVMEEPFACYIKVSVSNFEDARNISEFEHVKLLIDGEQYAPEEE